MDSKVLHRVTQIHPDDAYFKKTIADGIPALGVTGWWKKQYTDGTPCPDGYTSGAFTLSNGQGNIIFWAVKTEEVHDQ